MTLNTFNLKQKKCKIGAALVLAALLCVSPIGNLSIAAVMSSSVYKIQTDSINFGGGQSSSSNYNQESTVGEVATGFSTSTTYSLKAGYQQMQEVYIAMTAAADVIMAPAIGGITGGTSNGQTAVTVTTDSAAGYQMTIVASSSPAMSSGSNTIADYAPAGADPDYSFTVAPSNSAFGFSPEGTDIAQKFKDNGSACNVGSSDTANQCWDGLSTTDKVVALRTSANHPSGTLTTIKFRVTSGSAHVQAPGTYVATTTLTAVAL